MDTRAQRWPWLVFVGLLALLGGAAGLLINQEFEADLTRERESANKQLLQIAEIVTSELNLGNYQEIDTLFRHWPETNRNIVELRLVSANGFNLANYQGSADDKHVFELALPISYSYQDKATMLARVTLEPEYRSQEKWIMQWAMVLALFSALLAFLLHFAVKSGRESSKARHIGKLYKALSEVNQAIVRMEREAELLPLVCRCAVEYGGMSMAWVAKLNEEDGLFYPAANYGGGLDYLEGIVISSRADVPEGRGPTGTAVRENKPVIVNNYPAEFKAAPWHGRAASKGFKSAAAFPIQRGGKMFAALNVYHAQINAFDAETVALLEELSKDISFALDNFDRDTQRKAAEQTLQLAASIYQYSSEGMIITDDNNLIVTVNPAFTDISGYTLEEVVGKLPSIFSSGRHDMEFYQSMWNEINATGKWQGEIWDRRNNGEVYPNWVSINTIYNPDGSVHHRIALYKDISQKKISEELIWKQANFDTLTGLPNRNMFHDRLEQEVTKSHRTSLPLALLLIDLDQFKEVNDTLGHAVGDILLQEAAVRIRDCVRESDTVARLGGDEFSVVLPDLDDKTRIEDIAEKIISKIAQPYHLGSETAYVSASIGITLYPNDASDIDTLIKNADQAMYAAKNRGRNRFSYFTPSLQEAAQNRQRLVSDLRRALAAEQFRVYFQPIVELSSGRIHKAEALLRWQHPERGMVSPAEFISVAEETGLIIEIGNWVFKESARWMKRWNTQFAAGLQVFGNKSPVQFLDCQVSINVSPAQFKVSSNFFSEEWLRQLQELGLPGKSMAVEITEGLLLNAEADVFKRLLKLRDAGIQVSVDDFGTGYSSLAYLKKFDIDYLKIDQSFVRHLEIDGDDRVLSEAIIAMAHKLGLKVIAEGVETEGQRSFLAAAGCDYAQGYLFCKPVPPEEFEKLCGFDLGTSD